MLPSHLLDHGMGIMTRKEHDDLLRSGGLICRGGNGSSDSIACEYPKLVVTNSYGEIETFDFNGRMIDLQGEMAKRQREGKKVRIEYFPRAYTQYIERTNKNF